MDTNTTSSHFEAEGRSARFLRLQEAILPPYASLLCHSESAYQPCLNGMPNRVFMKLKLYDMWYKALSSLRSFLHNLWCKPQGTRLAGDSCACADTKTIQHRASVHTQEHDFGAISVTEEQRRSPQ